jgi:hypothetical protein
MTDNKHVASPPEGRGATDELLRSQLRAAKQTIQDREAEIARLKDDQRRPRFLLKRFVKEVRIRLEQRASRPATDRSLRYKHDTQLQALVADHPAPDRLLDYLAIHDASNIYTHNPGAGRVFGWARRLFWAVAAGLVKAGYFSAKAVFKLVKKVRHAASH